MPDIKSTVIAAARPKRGIALTCLSGGGHPSTFNHYDSTHIYLIIYILLNRYHSIPQKILNYIFVSIIPVYPHRRPSGVASFRHKIGVHTLSTASDQ